MPAAFIWAIPVIVHLVIPLVQGAYSVIVNPPPEKGGPPVVWLKDGAFGYHAPPKSKAEPKPPVPVNVPWLENGVKKVFTAPEFNLATYIEENPGIPEIWVLTRLRAGIDPSSDHIPEICGFATSTEEAHQELLVLAGLDEMDVLAIADEGHELSYEKTTLDGLVESLAITPGRDLRLPRLRGANPDPTICSIDVHQGT